MVALEQIKVEQAIMRIINKINETLEAGADVTKDFVPGKVFKSQVLVTAINRLAVLLEVTIPDGCYIFFDKKNRKQLNVTEAAEKLIKEANYGK